MHKNIEVWLKQGLYDLESAKINLDHARYSTCAFLIQQAVEKTLKALYLYENKGNVPQSHSLIYLANGTSVPKEYHSFLRILTPKFIDTRYPDASIGLPYELYQEEEVRDLFNKSNEVIEWIKKRLD